MKKNSVNYCKVKEYLQFSSSSLSLLLLLLLLLSLSLLSVYFPTTVAEEKKN